MLFDSLEGQQIEKRFWEVTHALTWWRHKDFEQRKLDRRHLWPENFSGDQARLSEGIACKVFRNFPLLRFVTEWQNLWREIVNVANLVCRITKSVKTFVLPVMMSWCFQTAWDLQITSWHFFRIPHKPSVLGRPTTSILRNTMMKLEIVPCHIVSPHIMQIDRFYLVKGRTWGRQGIV